jgi:hypothetical protein
MDELIEAELVLNRFKPAPGMGTERSPGGSELLCNNNPWHTRHRRGS